MAADLDMPAPSPALSPDEGGRIASVLGDLGNWAAAIATLRRVLADHPDHPRTLASLGSYLKLAGRPVEARQAAGAAVALAPDDAECHRTLAAVLRGAGAYRDAEAHYNEALRLNPENAHAHYGRAVLYTTLRRTKEASIGFQAAAARAPADPFILGNAAECLIALRRMREARDFADRAFACSPDDPTAQKMQARFKLLDGRHADALDIYRAAVANGATDTLALSGLIEASLCRYRVFALWSRALNWMRVGRFRAAIAVGLALQVVVPLVIWAGNHSVVFMLAVLACWVTLLGSLVAFCQVHQRRLEAMQRPVKLVRRF